ncbi:MAG: T9SS type A sorting domain-containing protein, partial [Bacteroidia bacterium]|nr:T9SS type A sorting domain-containing protein [Bacteroidia bacterium]
YPGSTMEQSLAQTSLTQDLAGSFTTPNGLYYLDLGCGGDMGPAGAGKSFVFHTGPLEPDDVNIAGAGPSYPVDFGLRWMDADDIVHELHFLPALTGEAYSSPVTLPAVTADSITAVTNTGATIWGNVTASGGASVTGRGIVYSTSVNPTLETGAKISAGTGTGPFSATLTGLAGGSYFVRVYATNSKGTAYANFGRFETRYNQSVISIWTEGWGSVLKGTGETNPYGALVWNGMEWLAHNTWIHKYFASIPSGKRLKVISAVKIANSSTGQVIDTLGYRITRGSYSYSGAARDSGSYNYSAVAYTIENKATGRQVVLRSRGTGNGTAGGYFDIYIEDETTSGSSVTSFRDGPNWFTWSGLTMQQALAQTSPTQGLTGSLPTTGGWYFMDIENGADLGPAGIGRSYVFHSDSLQSAAKTAGNGPAFPADFAIRWMDATGNVHEFDFLPKLVSQTYTAPFGVTTDSIAAIITNGATVWGNVVSGGGNPVTERGIVYSTTSNPTTGAGTKVTAGTGTGIFSVKLTGLLKDKFYHARAYAINTTGTVYGDDRSFIPYAGFIAYKTEGMGAISKSTGETNPNGALVWDCREWVANKTWEHRYLTDGITGGRLLNAEIINIPAGEPKLVFDTLNYLITRESYPYDYPSKSGGTYKYTAVSYLLKDTLTGKQVALRSRGTGNGTASAYFDIYLDDDMDSCNPGTVTALRGDPMWFTYAGITLQQALAQSSPTQGLTGNLPTIGGWYFLDEGCGGDVGPAGFGKSYTFHTGTMNAADAKTADLGSSYPVDFTFRLVGTSGNLHELAFLPKLISETYIPATGIVDRAQTGETVLNVYPNPFNIITTIECQVAEPGAVRLSIYDARGNELAILVDGFRAAGSFRILFSGGQLHLSPGIYFCVLKSEDSVLRKKMIYTE